MAAAPVARCSPRERLVPISFAAGAVAAAVSLYAVLLSAHLAGVIFRRNPEALERIYLG